MIVRLIEFSVSPFGRQFLCGDRAVGTVRVDFGAQRQELAFEKVGVEPGATWLTKQRKIIVQALKLSPQEQLVAALGFFTLNPPSSASR